MLLTCFLTNIALCLYLKENYFRRSLHHWDVSWEKGVRNEINYLSSNKFFGNPPRPQRGVSGGDPRKKSGVSGVFKDSESA